MRDYLEPAALVFFMFLLFLAFAFGWGLRTGDVQRSCQYLHAFNLGDKVYTCELRP